ncbi:MAG TPA: tricarballylate utilization 4Fe-4S protein TcuB [Vicinamibacterales bacterium]|nr:tricarballylate utilization 4Fe-4S protein TcuB [Vicinamibacterales bacterium]
MRVDDLLDHGAHVASVCNACRYCEQFCPVFPAIEQRLFFEKRDLVYLANLCHNCGECLYSCQFAPPHEFGIDVPRTMARIRERTYEEYAWPRWLASALRRNGPTSALTLAGVMAALFLAAVWVTNPQVLWQPGITADFYSVVPHAVMVALFGAVGLMVLMALSIGGIRFWREAAQSGAFTAAALAAALRDALTLRHLHTPDAECVSGEEQRTPWRRRFHHFTFYGFALCFASTTVAAVYHELGFEAPYAYASVPVILGTAGGFGLLIGPAGLWLLRRRRDPALGGGIDSVGADEAFLVLLVATSLTGLLLLAFRHSAAMSVLLLVHLGAVLALFLTLPYGKFAHGLYRTLALVRYRREVTRD